MTPLLLLTTLLLLLVKTMDGASVKYEWPSVNRSADSVSEGQSIIAPHEDANTYQNGDYHHEAPPLPPRPQFQQQQQYNDTTPVPHYYDDVSIQNTTVGGVSAKYEWPQVNVKTMLAESLSGDDQDHPIPEAPADQSPYHHDALLGRKVLVEGSQVEEPAKTNGDKELPKEAQDQGDQSAEDAFLKPRTVDDDEAAAAVPSAEDVFLKPRIVEEEESDQDLIPQTVDDDESYEEKVVEQQQIEDQVQKEQQQDGEKRQLQDEYYQRQERFAQQHQEEQFRREQEEFKQQHQDEYYQQQQATEQYTQQHQDENYKRQMQQQQQQQQQQAAHQQRPIVDQRQQDAPPRQQQRDPLPPASDEAYRRQQELEQQRRLDEFQAFHRAQTKQQRVPSREPEILPEERRYRMQRAGDATLQQQHRTMQEQQRPPHQQQKQQQYGDYPQQRMQQPQQYRQQHPPQAQYRQQQQQQQQPPSQSNYRQQPQQQHQMPRSQPPPQHQQRRHPPDQQQVQNHQFQHRNQPHEGHHVNFSSNTPAPPRSAASHTRRPVQPRPQAQQQQSLRTPADYPEEIETVYDVLIIGGGVVGLATLRAVTLAGYKAVLVEAEPDLLSGASAGNSGIACTGVDATPGTLERALIRDSISQLRPFLKTHRIPHRDCGSIVCQWEWDEIGRGMGRGKKYESPLNKVLAESHDAGDTHARKLTPHEVGTLEPNVSPLCVGAVHIPGEIVVDPWLYSIALGAHARENGARIFTNFEYDAEMSFYDPNRRIWTICRNTSNDRVKNVQRPASLLARSVVNAAGIMADIVQAGTKDCNPPHWRARPRRGQYKVFMADQVTYITHPIQPVPSQRTKGIFVFSSLYNHIVVGPTAEEQESRTDKRVNPNVADDLTTFALRLIPDLDPQRQHIGEYVGIRPATEHRDYQIQMSAHSNWIVAAGIRSTGLTGSLGIGRHILHLLQSILPPPKPPASIRSTPLPEMSDLVDHFNNNPQGHVLIHGYLYRVTHPLTRMGFKMRTGIAGARKGRR